MDPEKLVKFAIPNSNTEVAVNTTNVAAVVWFDGGVGLVLPEGRVIGVYGKPTGSVHGDASHFIKSLPYKP